MQPALALRLFGWNWLVCAVVALASMAVADAPEAEAPGQVKPASNAEHTLKSTKSWQRILAVRALAACGEKSAILQLAEAMSSDTQPGVREAAAHALAPFKEPEALNALLERVLKDDSEAVRLAAGSSLAGTHAEEAASRLIQKLEAGTQVERARGAAALALFPSPSTSRRLARSLLEDVSPLVRRLAEESLVASRDPGAVDALLVAAQGIPANSAGALVFALGRLRSSQGVPRLLKLLERNDSKSRCDILMAITRCLEVRTNPDVAKALGALPKTGAELGLALLVLSQAAWEAS